MKPDFLVYLSHSWGTTPEQKKKEHEYNVIYYRHNKVKWQKYRNDRLKEIRDEDLSIQRSLEGITEHVNYYKSAKDKIKLYDNTIKLLEKQYEKETDPKRKKMLGEKIRELQVKRLGMDHDADIALSNANHFAEGRLAYDTDENIYIPLNNISVSKRQSNNDFRKSLYERDRWEDPYARRERDRAKAYGENEKAKLEAQRKKSKK